MPSIETYKKLGFVGDKFRLYGHSDEPNQKIEIWCWREGETGGTLIATVTSDSDRFWSYTWTPDKPGFYTLSACTEEKCSRHPVEITVLPSWAKLAIPAVGIIGAVALYKFLKKRR